MRFPFLFTCLLIASVSLSANEAELEGWKLTFSDEFNGEKLDRRKWTPRDPWEVEINGELQAYVEDAFSVKDGILRIKASKDLAMYDGKVRKYSSGKMTTTSKFAQKYGRFEIRCKVPKGKGLWPAFWLLPDPPSWPPEIDILEFLGHETDMVYFSNHWPKATNPDESDSQTKEHNVKGVDFTADFHTYAVEWEPGEIRWYLDGKQAHRSRENVPDVRMFMLVNLAVGGGWPGDPDESTVFPAFFEVDYVRVWERKG